MSITEAPEIVRLPQKVWT